MKIVLLDGALANQMTQYIFARCLEIATGDMVYLDDLWFYTSHGSLGDKIQNTEHHEYQLNKFPNAKPNLISDYFEPGVWNEIIGIARQRAPLLGGSHLPQILLESGMQLNMVTECPTFTGVYDGPYVSVPYYYHMPKLLNCKGDIYFWGYFTNAGWFNSQKETLMNELLLPEPQNEADPEMSSQIENSYSVGVHIRRGGYAIQGNAHPPEYYKDAIAAVRKKHRNESLSFFIFSDEIEYCKEHAKEYGVDELKRVTWCAADRTVKDNHIDMQLMSKCRGLILCNSVYGFMSHLFSRRADQWTIDPHPTRNITIP